MHNSVKLGSCEDSYQAIKLFVVKKTQFAPTLVSFDLQTMICFAPFEIMFYTNNCSTQTGELTVDFLKLPLLGHFYKVRHVATTCKYFSKPSIKTVDAIDSQKYLPNVCCCNKAIK